MTIDTVFPSHEKDLGGGMIVRRALPAAARQSVVGRAVPICLTPGPGPAN